MKAPPGTLLVFLDCNMSYSTFVGAVLYDSTALPYDGGAHSIGESTMCYCDFTDVHGGWFNECNLTGSTFRGAQLPITSFTYANLCDVDFTGAVVNAAAFDPSSAGTDWAMGHPRTYIGTSNYGHWNGVTICDVPATYNLKTILPAGLDPSWLVLANTDPTSTIAENGDAPLSDFTGETLTPTTQAGTTGQMNVYDGNLHNVTFAPGTYNNMDGIFNTNLRGATFDGGRFPQGFYESNLGNPPIGGARGQAISTPGPPLVRQTPNAHLHLPDATVSTNPR
jgi:uncharacterized protein YjbI with pentapeptide repeats